MDNSKIIEFICTDCNFVAPKCEWIIYNTELWTCPQCNQFNDGNSFVLPCDKCENREWLQSDICKECRYRINGSREGTDNFKPDLHRLNI